MSEHKNMVEQEVSQEEHVRQMNEKTPHRLDFGDYGFLQFQKGPRFEVGKNGLYIEEDVLPVLVQHLKNLNKVLPSRETSLAITKLEECQMWLGERRRNRERQGVLGTYQQHQS